MTEQRKLLSTKEAAEYCGFKLSYFRKLMMHRVIPMYKPSGKLCFFKKEDLDAFLTGVRISSQEEIAEEAKFSGGLVLLLDEIHRLDKTKQDFLLPLLESGLVIMIGAGRK